jgi:hypothetical protein
MAAAGHGPHCEIPGDTDRYWLLLPLWLGRLPRLECPRAIINDIVWAQYCLFEFVSMQDEVLDSQSSSSDSLFGAYEFLAEAEGVLARRIRGRGFWRYYRKSLAQTARGILTAHGIQQGGPGAIEPLLSSYAAQASVLKVGLAAMCVPAGARDVFRRCSRFADHLAIGGQLLDDLEDLHEDLANRRLNAAARLLVPDAGPDTPDVEGRIATAVVLGKTATAVLQRIRTHARHAALAIAPLGLPQARPYFDSINADLDRVEAALNRSRIAAVFKPLLARERVGPAVVLQSDTSGGR